MDSPFRLSNCPRCDYRLTGLPAVGVCPECGRAYDESIVYLYGDEAPPFSGWSRAVGVSLISIACVWGFVAQRSIGIHLPRAVWAIPFILYGLLPMLWRSMTDQGSGVLQLKIGPASVRQMTRRMTGIPYAANDDRKPIPWKKIGGIGVGALPGGLVRLVFSPRPPSAVSNPKTHFVDVIVRCRPEAVNDLRRRIDLWSQSA